MPEQDPREVRVPLVLSGIGIALLFVGVWRIAGAGVFADVAVRVAVATALRVGLLLFGATITAKLINVSFGAPGTAILKLIAVVLLPAGISLAINITGVSWVISVIAYLVLLTYLFELDLREALIFTGVMLVLNIGLAVLTAGVGARG
ncbi:MAG: hypothetical protein ACHRHE_22510 [Tepidisphaerales bacterium]